MDSRWDHIPRRDPALDAQTMAQWLASGDGGSSAALEPELADALDARTGFRGLRGHAAFIAELAKLTRDPTRPAPSEASTADPVTLADLARADLRSALIHHSAVHGAVFDQLPAGEQRFLAQLDRAHREATRIGRVNAALTAMRGAAALAERTFGEAAQDALLAGGAAENLRLTHPAGPEESDLAARLAEISTAYARGETADAARLTVAGIQVAVEPGLSPGILTLTPVVAGLPRDHFADSDPGPAAVLGLRVSADEPDLVQRVNAHFQLLIGNVSGLRTQEWEAEGQMRQTRDDAQQLLDHRAFQLPQSDIGSRAEAVFDQACADLKALLAEPAGRRPADTASVSTRAVMEFDRQAATSLQAYLAKPNVPGHYASMVADSLKLIKALTAVAPAVSPPTARRTVRPAQPPALLEAPSGPTPPQAAL